MLVSLETLLQYQNPAVVRRFQKEHPDRAGDAEIIFKDLLRFFWASKRHAIDCKSQPKNKSLQFIFIMDEEMKAIDQMWHVFLLYTQSYMDFCSTYFGEYLHHLPDIVPAMGLKYDFHENLEKFLLYNGTLLDEETLARWFRESTAEWRSA